MKVKVLEAKDLQRPRKMVKVDLTPYLQALQQVPAGGGLEVMLEDGETARTVKRRFSRAATQMGQPIVYRTPQEGNFRIVVKEPAARAE